MKLINFLFVLITAFFLCSCAAMHNYTNTVDFKKERLSKVDKIVIMPPQFLFQSLKIDNQYDQFKKNLYIGEIIFDSAIRDNVHISSSNDGLFRERIYLENGSNTQLNFNRHKEFVDIINKNNFFVQYLELKGYRVEELKNISTINMAEYYPSIRVMYHPNKFWSTVTDYDNHADIKFKYFIGFENEKKVIKIKDFFRDDSYILFWWIESFYIHNAGKFPGRPKPTLPGVRLSIIACIYDIKNNDFLISKYSTGRKRKINPFSKITQEQEQMYINEVINKVTKKLVSDFK